MDKEALLKIRNLKTYFKTTDAYAKSVDDISFEIAPKETLGIVGESGSGKSVTALSILGLLPKPQGQIHGGEIIFQGKDLVNASEKELRNIRGNSISMIFQEPMTSLNPVYTIKYQITEAIRTHSEIGKDEAAEMVVELLKKVGIPDPEKRADNYPHEMSGGMRQRAMIAMALACNPQLIIADEPTTALDVTVQAQILDLLRELQNQIGMSIMLITHDLGVVAEMTDRTVVMYAGKIAEYTTTEKLFRNPCHPYTQGLMESIPRIDQDTERLYAIPGMVPGAADFPEGCRFSNRCKYADETCMKKIPEMTEAEKGHFVSCFHWQKAQRQGATS